MPFFATLISILIILGIWYSSYYLGAFVGPTLGGILVNIYGFDSMTVVFAGIFGVLFGTNLMEFLHRKYATHKKHKNYKTLDDQDHKMEYGYDGIRWQVIS